MPSAIWSPDYACDIGPHVFPVVKYRLVRDALIADGTLDPADVGPPPPPSRADLERAHTAAYLDDLEQLRWSPRTLYSELPLTPEIVNAYVLACGGTVAAAREALEHGAAVHLGGGFHHAFADKAEGFCYLNDLAVAARVLQAQAGVRRVAIVDLDVHQGNGTAGIFAGDDSVFTLSVHQENNYPMPKPPSDLDVGLADRTGDDEYLAALRPALERVWSFGPASRGSSAATAKCSKAARSAGSRRWSRSAAATPASSWTRCGSTPPPDGSRSPCDAEPARLSPKPTESRQRHPAPPHMTHRASGDVLRLTEGRVPHVAHGGEVTWAGSPHTVAASFPQDLSRDSRSSPRSCRRLQSHRGRQRAADAVSGWIRKLPAKEFFLPSCNQKSVLGPNPCQGSG